MADLDELHKKLDRLDSKVDHVIDKLAETNIILAKNTTSLEIHEKRTTASEHRIVTLEDENTKRKATNSVWIKLGAFVVGAATVISVIIECVKLRN